ncbi:hypothetical protein R6Q59_002680 [Mikania micrantha]
MIFALQRRVGVLAIIGASSGSRSNERKYRKEWKKREMFQDLVPLLWNSFGTIAALLQLMMLHEVDCKENLKTKGENVACKFSHLTPFVRDSDSVQFPGSQFNCYQ